VLKPQEFVETYAKIGAVKAKRKASELFVLGILAGLILGCAGASAATVSLAGGSLSATRLISSAIFPMGLVIIIFTGSELFTGNCLISISVLDKSTSLSGMLRNLVIVYLGNFVGCAAVAAVSAYCGLFDNAALAAAAVSTAAAKCSLSFGRAFFLGVMCNLMVCLGVVCAISATSASGKAVGAYMPVCLFIICGFEHSIANMYFVPAGLFAAGLPHVKEAVSGLANIGNLSWANFAFKNLLPVTLGNIAGGAGLGAALWYCGRKR